MKKILSSVLVLLMMGTTMIYAQSVSTEENATVQKVFENGVIIIIKDGVRYNVLGVRL